jgi:hypothetical protein
MTPYVAFGLAKRAAEQGEWAASAALSILHGHATPASIDIGRNRSNRCYFNPAVAAKAGVRFPYPSATTCQTVE